MLKMFRHVFFGLPRFGECSVKMSHHFLRFRSFWDLNFASFHLLINFSLLKVAISLLLGVNDLINSWNAHLSPRHVEDEAATKVNFVKIFSPFPQGQRTTTPRLRAVGDKQLIIWYCCTAVPPGIYKMRKCTWAVCVKSTKKDFDQKLQLCKLRAWYFNILYRYYWGHAWNLEQQWVFRSPGELKKQDAEKWKRATFQFYLVEC